MIKKIISAVVLFTIVFLVRAHASSLAVVNSDWPSYRYDAGGSSYNPNEITLAPPLKQAWLFQRTGEPGATSGVVVEEGRAFGAASGIYALDITTGQQLWHFTAFSGPVDDVGASSMALAGTTLYAVSRYGTLYALAADSGREIWHFGREEELSPDQAAPLVIPEGIVYAVQPGRVYLVSTAGTAIWQAKVGTWPQAPSYGNGQIYFATDSGVWAMDARNGDILWQKFSGMTFWGVSYAQGQLYASGTDGILYALDPPSGAVRWQFKTGNSILTEASIANDLVYVPSSDGYIYALDAASGREVWRQAVPIKLEYFPIVLANGYAYMVSGAQLMAFDARTGEQVSSLPLAHWPVVPLSVAQGHLFLGQRNGTILAFKGIEKIRDPHELPAQKPISIVPLVNSSFFKIVVSLGGLAGMLYAGVGIYLSSRKPRPLCKTLDSLAVNKILGTTLGRYKRASLKVLKVLSKEMLGDYSQQLHYPGYGLKTIYKNGREQAVVIAFHVHKLPNWYNYWSSAGWNASDILRDHATVPLWGKSDIIVGSVRSRVWPNGCSWMQYKANPHNKDRLVYRLAFDTGGNKKSWFFYIKASAPSVRQEIYRLLQKGISSA